MAPRKGQRGPGRPRKIEPPAPAGTFKLPKDIEFNQARPFKGGGGKLLKPVLHVRGKKARISLPEMLMAPIAGKGERYDWRQGLPPHQRFLKIFATNGAGGLKVNASSGNTSGFVVSPLLGFAALDRGGHYDLPHELTRDAEGKPVLYLELPAALLREDEP